MAGFAPPFKDKVEELEARCRWLYSRLQEEQDTVENLRAALAPLLAHADSHDYAPPIRFAVMECREIKEKVNG